MFQMFFPEQERTPRIPSKLLENYMSISIDPTIHNGWPYIKGTKILAYDIFRAIVSGHTTKNLLIDLKGIGVKTTEKQLTEAFLFTLEWLSSLYLNEKTSSSSTR